MQLKLYEPMQENDYYFKGYVSLKELSQLFSDYEFPEETLEKAAIQKKNMLQGISSFTAVLRMDPDSRTEVSEDMIVFTSDHIQICNGASKIAAICQMDSSQLDESAASISIFLTTEEKMKALAF